MSTMRWFLVTVLILVGILVAVSLASAYPEDWRVDSRRPSGAGYNQDTDEVAWWRIDERRPARFPRGTGPSDLDQDGVPDAEDACPATPRGATVDARGCPTDRDGDGVYDGLDACPETPRGATVGSRGCPGDADGDGVYDGLDRCPDTPRGASVDAAGCGRDSDGDGVPDGIDQCPDTESGAEVDARGCRVLSETESELLDTGKLVLQNVEFETNQAVLKPESRAVLDEVGAILVEWPELRLEVGGHTDNTGSAIYNQNLSDRRARAVREYLLERFGAMEPSQLTARGYGEEVAIASNDTAEGRARNRRVEFTVLSKDILRK